MKATVYLRVAKTARGYRYSATAKPSLEPLRDNDSCAIPTLAFAFRLDLPDGAFSVPMVGELPVPEDMVKLIPGGVEVIE